MLWAYGFILIYIYIHEHIYCQEKLSICVDLFTSISYLMFMTNRKMYNTTLDIDLMKKLKVLAAQMDKRHNDLIEEAIQDLLKKYEKKAKK